MLVPLPPVCWVETGLQPLRDRKAFPSIDARSMAARCGSLRRSIRLDRRASRLSGSGMLEMSPPASQRPSENVRRPASVNMAKSSSRNSGFPPAASIRRARSSSGRAPPTTRSTRPVDSASESGRSVMTIRSAVRAFQAGRSSSSGRARPSSNTGESTAVSVSTRPRKVGSAQLKVVEEEDDWSLAGQGTK